MPSATLAPAIALSDSAFANLPHAQVLEKIAETEFPDAIITIVPRRAWSETKGTRTTRLLWRSPRRGEELGVSAMPTRAYAPSVSVIAQD